MQVPYPLRDRLDQRDPAIQSFLNTQATRLELEDVGAIDREGKILDYAALVGKVRDEDTWGVDTGIAAYGCAFMCAVCAGAALKGEQAMWPQAVLTLWHVAGEQGFLEADCFVDDWEGLLTLCRGGKSVKYLGHKEPDFAPTEKILVIEYWHQPARPLVGGHFVLPPQPLIKHPYDPLGSFKPGLSKSRRYGEVANLRAFQI